MNNDFFHFRSLNHFMHIKMQICYKNDQFSSAAPIQSVQNQLHIKNKNIVSILKNK